MKNKYKISSIIIFAVMIAGIAYLTIAGDSSDIKVQITGISLSGGRYLNNAEYLKFAHLDNKEQFKNLSLNIVRDRISKHPYISKVNITFSQEGKIHIKIKEKIINALLLDNQKKYFLTNKFQVLPLLPNTLETNYPLIMNLKGNVKIKPLNSLYKNEEIKTCYKMILAMKAVDKDLLDKLSEIDLREGQDILFNMSNIDYPVIIGRGNEINKVVYLSKIWQHIKNNRISNIIEYIDLRFNENIYIGLSDSNNEEETEA